MYFQVGISFQSMGFGLVSCANAAAWVKQISQAHSKYFLMIPCGLGMQNTRKFETPIKMRKSGFFWVFNLWKNVFLRDLLGAWVVISMGFEKVVNVFLAELIENDRFWVWCRSFGFF